MALMAEDKTEYAYTDNFPETFRLKLERSIDKSYKDMDTIRAERMVLISEYNSKINDSNGTIINKLYQMIDTYQRLLSSSQPNVLVNTNIQALKPDAENLRLAINQLTKEIRFSKNLNRVVLDAMFGMGVMKTCLGKHPYKELEIDGEFFDPGQPFSKPVSLRHFVIDTAASELDQIDFIGDRYSCTREYIEKTYPDYDKKDIPAGGDTSWGENKPEERSTGIKENREERLRDYIWLWDVYLPKEGVVVTMFDGWGRKELGVKKWEGPEGGPYDILAFNTVPDEVIANPGAKHVYNLHKMLNDMAWKTWQQARSKKDIVTYEDNAEDDANAIKNAKEGEVIHVHNNSAVQERTIGMVDPQIINQQIMTSNQFNDMAGNIENLAGLGAQAETLGQEQIITQSTSAMINNMRKTTVEFATAIIEKLAWYIFNDPFIDMPLTKRVPGTTIDIEVRYTAEEKEGDFLDYNFDIEPYSLKEKTPQEELAAMLGILNQWVLPTAEMAQQSGFAMNFEATSKRIAELSGISFEDLYIPLDPSLQTAVQANGPIGQPPQKKETVNTRVSVSGTTRRGLDQNLMMANAGAQPQNAGTAQLQGAR